MKLIFLHNIVVRDRDPRVLFFSVYSAKRVSLVNNESVYFTKIIVIHEDKHNTRLEDHPRCSYNERDDRLYGYRSFDLLMWYG